MARPINPSEPYDSAVSISIMLREIPVRSACSSSAWECLPFASPAEPWPNAGTTVPSGSFTVLPPPFEGTPLAASSANAPEHVTSEPNAAQIPLNSRRFSSSVSLFINRIPVTAPPLPGHINPAQQLREVEQLGWRRCDQAVFQPWLEQNACVRPRGGPTYQYPILVKFSK